MIEKDVQPTIPSNLALPFISTARCLQVSGMGTQQPDSMNTPSATIVCICGCQWIRSPKVCTAPIMAGTPLSPSISNLSTPEAEEDNPALLSDPLKPFHSNR
jgi:hypothetical protein